MSDFVSVYNDKQLDNLERRIHNLYKHAHEEALQDAEKAWKKIENGIGEKYRQYQDGEISQQDYYAWLNGNKKIAKLRDEVAANIADRMTKSADIASAYINDTTPRVFKENANRAAYTIEKGMKGGVSFSLINDDSLRAIMTGNTTEFKARWKDTFTDPPKIYKWSYSKVQDSLYMGMVKGESIQTIAKRIQQVTGSDMSVAVRNARTSMTCAVNQGQMATFERAASMGIEIKKEWISTHDGRVRDSHASLDGVKVPYKEKFPNGLMCPADPSGAPAEVYNCRCTMARVPFDDEDTAKYTEKRYQEWKKEKEELKKGLGANNDYARAENHDSPKKIGKLGEVSDKKAKKKLRELEKDFKNENIEVAYVITQKGDVYKCFGIKNRVYIDYDIGDELNGAYVTHNHLSDYTNYSFSSDDIELFNNYGLKLLRGSDDIFEYELSRYPESIDKQIPITDITDYDGEHVQNIKKAKQYGIGYRRWKK